MASKELGFVKSGKRNSCRVSWDEQDGRVYVKGLSLLSAWQKCDARAKTARDAMDVAEAYLHNR